MKVSLIILSFLAINVPLQKMDSILDANSINEQKSLNIDGLQNAEIIDYLYRGHFENLEITREDDFYYVMLEKYMYTSAGNCSEFFLGNKVKIMEDVCKRERVTTNGFGIETNRTCIEWTKQWTGLYAKKEVYNALTTLKNLKRGEELEKLISIIADQNAIGNSLDFYHKIKSIENDFKILFQNNSCQYSELLTFEKNLINFALKKPGVKSNTRSKFEKLRNSSGPEGKQNYTNLIDDMISEQSKNWMMNRYNRNSVSNIQILSYDNNNIPMSIKANYEFTGFGGKKEGWAKITLKNGKPDCIYFWDFPKNCKKPSSSIVYDFQNGKYQSK